MWNKIIFIFIFCTPFFLSAQRNIEYLNYANKAEYFYHNSEIDSALNLLKSAKQKFGYLNLRDFWIYLELTKQSCNDDKCYRILKKRLPNEVFQYSDITKYLDFKGFQFSHRQIKALSKILPDTLSSDYLHSKKMNTILDEMERQDQDIRKAKRSINNRVAYQNDSIDYYEAIKIVNDLNAKKLTELINNENFIECQNIDPFKLSILLLHMSSQNFSPIEGELIEMINLGNLDPYHFATAKDRKLSNSGNCYKYFAYTLFAEDINCTTYEEIVESRKQIGLSIYYTRSSVRRIVPLGKQDKHPLKNHFQSKIGQL